MQEAMRMEWTLNGVMHGQATALQNERMAYDIHSNQQTNSKIKIKIKIKKQESGLNHNEM